MDFGIEKFTEVAKKLSHNPLGIIALFIWLVYAIAALVMMCSINYLYPHESLMLLLFIILFPVVILFVFFRLVTAHNEKLYAPKDYRTDDSFLKTLNIEEQIKQIDLGIEEQKEQEQEKNEAQPQKAETKLSVKDLRSKYILAENLVFRILESELNVSIKKACRLGPEKDTPILDGVFFKNEHLNIIEIKLISAPRFALIGIGLFLSRLYSYYLNQKEKGIYPGKMRVLLVVVADGSTDQRNLKFRIKRVIDKYPDIKVDIRLFDFKELKQKFGIE